MSGPYGYGGYAGYSNQGYNYGQRPPIRYPPGQQPPPGSFPPGQYPPGQPGYPGYPAPPRYGQQQPPPAGYQPRFTGPPSQPQGYTPAPTAGYTAASSGTPPSRPHIPAQGNKPPAYQPSRPAPAPPSSTVSRPPDLSVPASFHDLSSMSNDQLQELMDSEEKLAEYFESRDDIKRLQNERAKLVSRNEELATYNMSMKPELEAKQQELIELYSELESQRTQLSGLQQQRQALANHYAPHNILARLKIAASEVEEETEGIAESFLNGDIAIDEFLKTYIPKKTLCHSRRAKEEKMEKMGI